MTKNNDNVEKDFENRWCKFCIAKTKQEIIFQPKIPTYKRRRQYKCTICGKCCSDGRGVLIEWAYIGDKHIIHET